MTDQALIETNLSGATIRRRKKNETSLSDACCTPKWLADRLPLVDIDPASNPRSWIRSLWSYSLEKKLDGLRLPWRGSAFLNHPYSGPMPWMIKLNYELSIVRCTSAIVLAKLDCSTDWWKILTAPVLRDGIWHTPDQWQFDDRIEFEMPPELIEKRRREIQEKKAAGLKAPPEKTTNNFCSVIIHHRFDGALLKLEDVATLWTRGN